MNILQTLLSYLNDGNLSLPATAFGAGGIQDVLTEYFPGGTLALTGVVPDSQGEAVTLQNATGNAAPIDGMTVAATFSPGSDGVELSLTATPPTGWTFGASWPLLAGGVIADLTVSNATLTLSSVAQSPLAQGLNFAGTIGLGTGWGAVQWLLGGASTLSCQGAIGQQGTVPIFSFSVPITGPVSIPVLGELSVALDLSCEAVSGTAPPGAVPLVLPGATGPTAYPWVPQTSIGLGASISLAGATVPLFVDLSSPSGTVTIVADVSQVGQVALADLASVVAGADLAGVLPPASLFDPGELLSLETLTFTLLPATQTLSSVGIVLGTTASWTVTPGLAVGPIQIQLLVEIREKKPLASLLGTVSFPGGALQLGAHYPSFTFTGGLAHGSRIGLTQLLNVLLPVAIDAQLDLDDLNFVIQPTVGSFSLTTGITGDWSIPVGIGTLELTGAWLQLDRVSLDGGMVTTGSIQVQGTLQPSTGGSAISFDGSWVPPGKLVMTGDCPGDILGPLESLFSGDVQLHLLAAIDPGTPLDSSIQALWSGDQGTNALSFTSLAVTLEPGATTFSLTAAGVLTIEDDAITLSGSGSITLEPATSLTLTLEIDNWVEPFGIAGLTIEEFGLQVGVEDGTVTAGLLGSFDIGSGSGAFTLVVGGELIDFEAPGAIVFELNEDNSDNPLMLSDVIEQFTSLDLASVPVLNAVGFTSLQFWVVDDPEGFTVGSYTFPPGIGIDADVFVYSWEAQLGLQVSSSQGIIASGSINQPIELGGGLFSLANAAGTAGPSASINTSSVGSTPYFTLDGQLALLGISAAVQAEVMAASFDFTVSFDFFETVTASLSCALLNATSFSATSSFTFDLDVWVGPLVIDGQTLVPQVHIKAPEAALSLSLAINPQVTAQLQVALSIDQNNVNFTLSAADIEQDLTNLYGAVVQWLEDNVQTVFASDLSSPSAWVAAIEGTFSALIGDITNITGVLGSYFGSSSDATAAFLKQLGFSYQEIVQALVQEFDLTYDLASQAVNALWGPCSMGLAEDQAWGAAIPSLSLRQLEFLLTGSPGGRRLLAARYIHGDEIWRRLAPRPHLRRELQALADEPWGASDLGVLCATLTRAATAVAPSASPELQATLGELLPELARYQHMNHHQLSEVLTW